jgi:wobble nucleotide-excising tRNase
MAQLTSQQRKDIKSLKDKIISEAMTVSKIQCLTPTEDDILREVLTYNSIDKIGNYNERMTKLNKNYYAICGILFHHLDSPQIQFGNACSITVNIPCLANPSLGDEFAF